MMTTDQRQPRARSRVLVVDDSPDVADSLALLLKTFGAEVRVARSGEEGLAICAEFSPELILLDVCMPGMDGFETARRLRKLPVTRRATLVALTGRGEQDMRRRVKDAGFDHHLTKPADPDELASLLEASPEA
jgi:CheY-like chemotaxis protein